MKALITGANGFVGQRFCAELLRQKQTVRAVVRSANIRVECCQSARINSLQILPANLNITLTLIH